MDKKVVIKEDIDKILFEVDGKITKIYPIRTFIVSEDKKYINIPYDYHKYLSYLCGLGYKIVFE